MKLKLTQVRWLSQVLPPGTTTPESLTRDGDGLVMTGLDAGVLLERKGAASAFVPWSNVREVLVRE